MQWALIVVVVAIGIIIVQAVSQVGSLIGKRLDELEEKIDGLQEKPEDIKVKLDEIKDLLEGVMRRLSERLEPIEERPPSESSHYEFFPELNGVRSGLERLNKIEREMRDADRLNAIRSKDAQGLK